jgi:hypothetical protein
MIISNAHDITVAPLAGNVSDWLAAAELAGTALTPIQKHLKAAKSELDLAQKSHTKAVNQALAGKPASQLIHDAELHFNRARAELNSLITLAKNPGAINALKKALSELNLAFFALRDTNAMIISHSPTLRNQIGILDKHVNLAKGILNRFA